MLTKESILKWNEEDIRNADRIILAARKLLDNKKLEAHARGVTLGPEEQRIHVFHGIACLKIFGVYYTHEKMHGVRSYISHVAALAKANQKTDHMFAFAKAHVEEHLRSLHGAFHPEDEQDLAEIYS